MASSKYTKIRNTEDVALRTQFASYQGSDYVEDTMATRLGPHAEIGQLIDNLNKKNNQLERMAAKLGTSADTHEYRERLDQMRKDAQDLCRKIWLSIKDNSGGRDKAVMEKLTSQFQQSMEKTKRLNQDIEKKYQQIVLTMSYSQKDAGSPLEDDQKQQQLMDDIDVQFRVYDLEEIKRQKDGILNIERDVRQLNEMFEDLRTLVYQQQENLDIITDNITTAKSRVEEGHQEIQTAESYQKSARKKMCCLLFVILAVVAGIVLAVVYTQK